MTLDEAIKHCEEVAENQEWMASHYDDDSMGSHDCKECADEHRQLAEWLKKLKAYEEADKEIRSLSRVWAEGIGIRKCIDVIDKQLEGVQNDT